MKALATVIRNYVLLQTWFTHIFFSFSLSANLTKWSNTVGKSQRIIWVCSTILWGLRLRCYPDAHRSSSLSSHSYYNCVYTCNLVHNVLELHIVLVQAWFSTRKTKLDIYYEKLFIKVVSGVVESLKAWDLSKLENVRKISNLGWGTA